MSSGAPAAWTPPAAEGDSRDEIAAVAAAAAGDLEAFHLLYRCHLDAVARLARWLLGTADVDDVIQEVFVRTWRKLDTFAGRSSFGTWLRRLAVHVILRHRQRAARHSTDDREAPEDPVDPRPAPDLRLDLNGAVERLPVGARTVFVLFDVEGHSHDEIARRLGISPQTSRSQLHRARMLLRAALSREER